MDDKFFWHTRDAIYIINELVANSDSFENIVCDLTHLGIIPEKCFSSILNFEGSLRVKAKIVVKDFLFKPETRTAVALEKIAEVLYRNGLTQIAKHIDMQSTLQYSERDETCSFREDIYNTPHMQFSASLPTLQNLPRSPPPLTEAYTVPDVRDFEPFSIRVIPAQYIFSDGLENYRNESMPRGYVFIANMRHFHDNSPMARPGSEIDVRNLNQLFTQMGYYVQIHTDLGKGDLIKALTEFRNDKCHEHVDSCVVVLMSHGQDEHTFFTADNRTMRDMEVMEMFNNIECPALRKKPKIFIFQFCRGKCADIGVENTVNVEEVVNQVQDMRLQTPQADGINFGLTIPLTKDTSISDIFSIYATIKGYVAYLDNNRGSWLVQSICQEFMEYAWNTHLADLVNKVTARIQNLESSKGNKQSPEWSSLGVTKHFYFNPQPISKPNWTVGDPVEDPNMNVLSPSLSTSSLSNSWVTHPHQRRHLECLEWQRFSRSSTPDPFSYEPQNFAMRFRSRHGSGASVGSGSERESSPSPSVRSKLDVPGAADSRRRSFSDVNYFGSEMSRIVTETESEDVLPGEDVVDTECVYGRAFNGTGEDFREWRLRHAPQNVNTKPSSLKRELSVPNESEAMRHLNGVRNYLQVNNSDDHARTLQAIEEVIKKNKAKAKRRKNESNSLDY